MTGKIRELAEKLDAWCGDDEAERILRAELKPLLDAAEQASKHHNRSHAEECSGCWDEVNTALAAAEASLAQEREQKEIAVKSDAQSFQVNVALGKRVATLEASLAQARRALKSLCYDLASEMNPEWELGDKRIQELADQIEEEHQNG